MKRISNLNNLTVGQLLMIYDAFNDENKCVNFIIEDGVIYNVGDDK